MHTVFAEASLMRTKSWKQPECPLATTSCAAVVKWNTTQLAVK